MQPQLYSVASASDPTQPIATFSSLGAMNFSGHSVEGVRSAFTVGGWVRRTQTGLLQTIFNAPGQFQLWFDANGYLTGSLADVGNSGRSLLPVSDSNWHHVAASFQQDYDGEGAGMLTIFLDGLPNATEVEGGERATPPGTFMLGGGQSDGIEVGSWTLWTRALPNTPFDLPPWGAPATDSPLRTGLLAVFDFAGGSVTSSNQDITIVCSKLTTIHPCLVLDGPAYATVTPKTTLVVGNNDPWSLLFWVKAPLQSASEQFEPFSNESASPNGNFTLAISLGPQQSIAVTRKLGTENPVVFITAPCNVTDWTHVALIYDTQRLLLYLQGSLVATSAEVALTNIFNEAVFAGGEVPACFLQNVSIWKRAVGADELVALANSVPVDASGLQASFPLLTDLYDTVAGLALVPQLSGDTFGADTTTRTSVTSTYQALPSTLTRRDPGDALTLVADDYWNLAQSLGITIPSMSERDETQSPDLAAFYQSSYFNIAEPARELVIDHFDRAYRLANSLRARGIKAGRVETSVENGQTVFYYNTIDGQTEIDRRDLSLSAMDIWLITILMDVLFVIFALVGVAVTPRAVGDAVRRSRLAFVFTGLRDAINRAPPGISGAMMIVSNIIGLLSNAGVLASIVWNIISYSWWDLLFVGLSILVSILAIVIAPASVGWRLANAGVAIANLAYDLTQKPRESTPTEN